MLCHPSSGAVTHVPDIEETHLALGLPPALASGLEYLPTELDIFAFPSYAPLPGAWVQHVSFARWLTATVRPRCYVELGSEHGLSYFAFCEAMHALAVPGSCFAVDHWQGDAHTGEYGNDVFDAVSSHNVRYQSFSTLIRSTFEDALVHFEDESIDILHIDGHHSYESVSSDFSAWFRKVRPGGIVLLHDTNVRKLDFGVHRLMRELVETWPGFEFPHGNGLGVIVKGDATNVTLRTLVNSSSTDLQRFIGLMGWLGSLMQGTFDSGRLPVNLRTIDENLRTIDENLRTIHETQRIAEARLIEIHQMESANVEAIKKAHAEIGEMSRERDELKRAVDDIERSTSWRITMPLRALKSMIARSTE